MIYGAYKNVRNSAWKCLIDFKVCELPVKPAVIAKTAGIKLIKNSDVHELDLHESGKSIYDGSQWYVIYDNENTRQRCRFTIAHELGHIFLGHQLRKGYHARTFDITKPAVEQEADAFAARLLAPACVLWALEAHSAEEISALCDISKMAAQIRAERMEILYKRNKFLASSLERKVYDNFSDFIKNNKTKNPRQYR